MTKTCPKCGKTFTSCGENISLGMHMQYKHNPNSKYRKWLERKRAAQQ